MWSQSVKILNPYEAISKAPAKSEKKEKDSENK